MDKYNSPMVTEYGNVEELTRGNFEAWEHDGSFFHGIPLIGDDGNDPS
jgi:hypothetical protein